MSKTYVAGLASGFVGGILGPARLYRNTYTFGNN
jgi:hypothetical protein